MYRFKTKLYGTRISDTFRESSEYFVQYYLLIFHPTLPTAYSIRQMLFFVKYTFDSIEISASFLCKSIDVKDSAKRERFRCRLSSQVHFSLSIK